MDSREDILKRIRKRVGRDCRDAAAGRADIEAYLARRAPGPRPVVDDLLQRFVLRAEAMASTVEQVDTLQDVPVATARYLAGNQLPLAAVVWPGLAQLPWEPSGIRAAPRMAEGSDLVGVTGAFCAVAETGTLVLCSGGATPATVSLLPETHIAVVAASRIVAGMEDAWKLARAELGELPRAVNFVSGPSRTGDIEQTIVLGAHGPYRVHIVILRSA